jgi:uncharacterized protein (TIGR01777 family)
MRIFVTGGTGFVGTGLVSALLEKGHRVTVISRSPGDRLPTPDGLERLRGDPAEPGDWQEEAGTHDAVVNLAGATIFRRWTDEQKSRIRDSRIRTTRNVAEALARGRGPAEKILLNASGTGYYGFHGDEEISEDTEAGEDFLARLAADWEQEALAAQGHGTRVALCRFGIVLGRQGGALKKMVPAFRMGLGSPLGTGDQWFPWIHERDLVEIFLFLLEQGGISGPVNCTAPSPVRNREFTRTLAEVLHRPAFLPAVPGRLLRLAAGEFGDVLLQGQKAVPATLLANGFAFRFPTLREALTDLTSP